jgi:hypothetical protein
MRAVFLRGIFLAFLVCFLAAPSFGVSGMGANELKIVSLSLINQDPYPAPAGDLADIRIGVENKGGLPVSGLVIEILPEYPFELASGEQASREVAYLGGYQGGADMQIVKYKLKVDHDAKAGQYEIKFNVYEKGDSLTTTRSLTADVSNRENAEIIYIDKTVLVPGKQDTLKFTLNNVGRAPLNDLTFRWSNPDKVVLPVGSDNTRYVRYLDVGESADIEYAVIADSNINAGLYSLDLQLTYRDSSSGNTETVSTVAGIYIGGGTEFDIVFSDRSTSSSSLSIANVGPNPAYSVAITIPQQSGWTVSGSNSYIIGNLNKGDYTVASFSLQSGASGATGFNRTVGARAGNATPQDMEISQPNAGSNLNFNALKVSIAYTDTRGERQIIEKSVPANFDLADSVSFSAGTVQPSVAARRGTTPYQTQSFYSKYFWPLASLALIILGFAAYTRHRKLRKKYPDIRYRDIFKPYKPKKG